MVRCQCTECVGTGRRVALRVGKRAPGCRNTVNSTNLYVDRRDMNAVAVANATASAERSGSLLSNSASDTVGGRTGRGRQSGSHRNLCTPLHFGLCEGDGTLEHAALLSQEWECCQSCFQAWYVIGSVGLLERARAAFDGEVVETETAVRDTTSSSPATDSVVAWMEMVLVPECESYPATTHGEGYFVTFYYTTAETYLEYMLCKRPGVVYSGGSHDGNAGPSRFAKKNWTSILPVKGVRGWTICRSGVAHPVRVDFRSAGTAKSSGWRCKKPGIPANDAPRSSFFGITSLTYELNATMERSPK